MGAWQRSDAGRGTDLQRHHLLRVRFTFAVPRLHLEALSSMIRTLVIGEDEIRHALLVGARFRIRASEVTGCMVLVLGVTSLERFIQAVEDWANGDLPGV